MKSENSMEGDTSNIEQKPAVLDKQTCIGSILGKRASETNLEQFAPPPLRSLGSTPVPAPRLMTENMRVNGNCLDESRMNIQQVCFSCDQYTLSRRADEFAPGLSRAASFLSASALATSFGSAATVSDYSVP